MSVDIAFYNKLILTARNHANTDTSLPSRVYESNLHDIALLDQFDFLGISNSSLMPMINDPVSVLEPSLDSTSRDIYFTVLSSRIYDLMLKFVQVPTTNTSTTSTIDLVTCSISIKDSYNFAKHRQFINLLAFLDMDLDRPLLVMKPVLEFIKSEYGSLLNIVRIDEQSVPSKRLPLNMMQNEAAILSFTKQTVCHAAVNSILNFKHPSASLSKDNCRMDNLQHFLIMQQLRFFLYLSLRPVLLTTYVRFNSIRQLCEHTGNLFFKLSIPNKPIYNEEVPTFSGIVNALLDYGFYPSIPNIKARITFGTPATTDLFSATPPAIKVPPLAQEYLQLVEPNPLYSLLFRLCDVQISSHQQPIDNFIINGDFNGLEEYLTTQAIF